MDFDYDVCLSFAGEDRGYVEQVAENLDAMGIRVFYDRYVEVELWGKDLYTHLDEVYQRQCRYCVMFISEYYKEKLWTNHERQSALARAWREKGEYVLPVRLDDTVLPGIRPTTGYIDVRESTPEYLARLIVKKINPDFDVEEMLEYLNWWLNEDKKQYNVYVKGTKIVFEGVIEDYYYNEYPLRLFLEMHRLGELERMFLNSGMLVL